KEQFIAQVGKILHDAQVSVVPAEMAKLEGFFEGMEQVTHAVSGQQPNTKGAR
ncbi:MAG: paraslipin, partial [Shewanella sp.]